MTTLNDLRTKIYDHPKAVLDDRLGVGDGIKTLFKCRYTPVMDGTITVTVGGEGQVEGEEYTFDCRTGLVAFETAPGDGDEITACYSYAAFTDDELQGFLDISGGNLSLAAADALTSLLISPSRLVSWGRDDTRIDYAQVRKDLMEIIRKFTSQGSSETGGARVTDIQWEEII